MTDSSTVLIRFKKYQVSSGHASLRFRMTSSPHYDYYPREENNPAELEVKTLPLLQLSTVIGWMRRSAVLEEDWTVLIMTAFWSLRLVVDLWCLRSKLLS